MSQGETVGDLDLSVGYVLKQAQAALRAAMDAVLRPLELTVPQYVCLELLGRRPGLSSSELARSGFVSRQAMNLVLRGLQERGLLSRPPTAERGRARSTELTLEGQRVLRAASVAVADVERRMLAPLDLHRQRRLLQDLVSCADSLAELAREPSSTGPGRESQIRRHVPW